MRTFGRWLQIIGLTLPPLAILLNLLPADSTGRALLSGVGQMLAVLVAALCLFWMGRIVEGYARQ